MLLQVNVLMWAAQPALAGALNREFRLRRQKDEDSLYPVVAVRDFVHAALLATVLGICVAVTC